MCVSSISISALPFPVASLSDMFDWDDSELVNILWDEATQNGDHIVPYPRGTEDCRNKKEWKEEVAIVKPNEQEETGAEFDLNETKPESSSNLVSHDENSAPGMGMELWPDLPSSSAANTSQEAVSTEVPNNLTEITKYDSARGIDQLDKDSELYQSNQEGKEQGDFVDYSWASIGSFDDFDRIFSNDDPVFGHGSLDNADGLWSASRDVNNSAGKSFPISSDLPGLGAETLSNASQHLKIKAEYVQNGDLSCSLSYGETDNSSPGLHSVHGILNPVEDAAGESMAMSKEQTGMDPVGNTTIAASLSAAQNVATAREISDKVRKRRKPMRSRRRMEEKIEGKLSQELYGSWSSSISPSGQLENRAAHLLAQHSPSPVQHMPILRPELFPYQHISNQFVAPPVYGNLTNLYPAMPVLSNIHPGKLKHQQLLSSYNISPANRNPVSKLVEAPVKPITMTPQEKIEKLRRRQQLQAMLAIEKQHQQLSQHISSTTHSTIQGSQQKQQGVADHEIDDMSNFSSLEPNSPVEQDDSNTISATVDDYSAEETILHRLQDVTAKLDMTVRICIRDSLFRLAQSAMRRQSATDTSSTNKSSREEHEALAKEEINSFNRLQDSETETNPIDRTVAHLLFHRPPELSVKQSDASESPCPIKLPSECRAASVPNMPEMFTTKQNFVHQESKVFSPLVEPDQCKDSPCLDTSENASSIGLTDGGTVAVESSQ